MKRIQWSIMRFLSLALAICTSSLSLSGQITVKGKVLEANKVALPFANVRLTNKAGKLQGGQATDKAGMYRITGIPEGIYVLEVSYVGYKSHRDTITLSGGIKEYNVKDITLLEDGQLKEITVTGKATEVVIKGDTIEYNAGSFATSEGAALEELLKKLPGASIDDKGNITVNGKSITQIMVDGKRFFQSDPKVALKNLPAELIEKVQVLDKQSDNARMTGFADGEEETVINLTIKPGRKRGLFGTAFIGAGTKNRYEGSAMVNRFLDSTQFTLLGGLNNTNNAGFSDISSDPTSSGLAMQASGGGNRRPGQRSTGNDGITLSRILGTNAVFSISSTLQTGGSAFLGNSDKSLSTKSETSNILSNGSTTEQSVADEHNNKWNVGTNMRLEWKPDSRTEIILSPRLSYGLGKGLFSSKTVTTFIPSTTGASTITTNDITQTTDSRLWDGRINLDLSRRLSERGRTLAFSLEGQFSGNNLKGAYIGDATGTTNDINQDIDNREKATNLRLRINYVEPLGSGFALQANYQLRGEFSDAQREARDNVTGTLSSAGTYDQERSFLSHRMGFAVKKANKKLDLTLGLNIDPSSLQSTTTRKSISTTIRQSVTNFSPTLRLSYREGKAFQTNLDYRGQSFQPSVNQLAPINDNTNPLVVFKGNPNLLPGFRHNIFGRASFFWATQQRSLNLFFFGNLTENSIVPRIEYDPSTRVRTTTYDNVNGSWGAGIGGFFTTPIFSKVLSLRLASRNNYSNEVGFISNERNDAKRINLNEEITLAIRHKGLDTSIKGVWSHNSVRNSHSSANSSATNDYGVHWDTNLRLPLGLALESQVRYTTSKGYAEGFNYDQTLVNLGLSFSFLRNKAATIRVKVYDLLAEQRNVYREVSALATSSQESNIIGRYAMLHFIYKFNSFSGNASASDMKSSNTRPGFGGPPPPGRF